MDALRSLGGEDWFALGDGDMALHVLRTLAMARGQTLTDITRAFAAAWNIDATILPMTDQSVATCLSTDEGELEFQPYFVYRQCSPRVERIDFRGAVGPAPAPRAISTLLGRVPVLIHPSIHLL